MREEKKCPVDRGKLLIGLECCRRGADGNCMECPYFKTCDKAMLNDAMAYIGWLEEKLEGNKNAEGD